MRLNVSPKPKQIMNSTTNRIPCRFAGSRLKTCCGRCSECACRRPNMGNINVQNHFSDNCSLDPNNLTYFNFNKCKINNCKIKCKDNNMVLPLNNFKSSTNGRNYTILTDANLNCKSMNIIYLITCNICKIQYIGETQRSFEIRMKEHLFQIRKHEQNIRSGDNNSGQLIYKHFCCDDLHRNTPLEKRIRFQIVEKIRTDDISSDPKVITKRRTERELYWISKLRTAHPLGLNDMIAGYGIRGKATDVGFRDFNYLRISNICEKKPTRSHKNRHRKKKRKAPTIDHFRQFLDDLNSKFDSQPRNIEAFILSKPRKYLERFLLSTLANQLRPKLRHLLVTRVDFARKLKPIGKEVVPLDWSIDFSHKSLELININSILNNPKISKLLPPTIRNKLKIRKIFKFENPVSSKILNYNKILKSTGNLSYGDIQSLSCECADSVFKNPNFDHVITGDLNIIQETDLRKLCSFGTKFRDIPRFNLGSIKEKFRNNCKTLMSKISKKFKIPHSALKLWKKCIISNFDEKLQSIAKDTRFNVPTLSKRSCLNELKRLQEKFVITVIDKAAGNYAFTCKKFYFLRLAEELGLNNPTPGNETYLFCPDSEQVVCDRLKNDLLRFSITPPSSQLNLAVLYQTPKFHKNPPKMRYIAGNVNTVTSMLDDKVAKILKMCKSHFRNLCKVYESYSGIKYCFDVETSTEVKDMFDGAYGSVASISINDFSTLYTLFDHEHLLSNIRWLLDTLSKNSGKSCIKIDYDKARWVSNASDSDSYTVGEVLDMVSFLVKETYIKAFGHIFQQVKGIIMGGKISGWLSDCSLMVDEFRYVKSKISSGLREDACRLKFFRRYRDDCTTLNCPNFIDIAREIYPQSLSLTQENEDPSKANVLDMEVSIANSICTTKVYCKTDHFPFEVISFPFLESNIDNGLCYRVFYSQVIRFQRLCSNRCDFETRTRHLGIVLKGRGYIISRLEKEFCKAVRKYISEFQKWSLPFDFNAWFKRIMNERRDSQSALDVSTSSQPVSGQSALPVPMSFSQPVSGQSALPVPMSFSQPVPGFDSRSDILSYLSQP